MKDLPATLYHVLLNENFPLKKVIDLLPYLEKLGIDGLYCSPIFEAHSAHGYDITNPNAINSKIGGFEDFENLVQELKKREMKLVLDVVPNHMSIKGENLWWQDVLEFGAKSEYAGFFDIDWEPQKKELKNKILLPILDKSYEEALEAKEIQLKKENGKFWIVYADYKLPVSRESDPENEKDLHSLLEKQHYRLAHWLAAGQEINYRRFFNINDLVAIHIEKENVLKAHHQFIFDLVAAGKVQGLRIDHPDGLYDPTQYFERLREKKPAFVVCEKILDFNETLPEEWAVEGTVGYEFLNLLSGIFIQKKSEEAFSKIYDKFIGYETDFDLMLYERKKRFIKLHMGSELNTLGGRLASIAACLPYAKDFTRIDLTHALQEIMACFPLYRTYITEGRVTKRDRDTVILAVESAKQKLQDINPILYDFIRDVFLLELKNPPPDADDFVLRFQQQTAPVMAKGLEDSCFYIFNRFSALCEVGGNPRYFGSSRTEFHEFNLKKLKKWPLGFLPASTQDTKWSEDARMRLAFLSEIPKEWELCVTKWSSENQKYKTKIQGELLPEPNIEYYLYQMLLASWPEKYDESYSERLHTCFMKAIRESGLYTSWEHPDIDYENAASSFLTSLLKDKNFLSSFLPLQKKISEFGKLNSLSSLVLRVGSPGIVDLFQGNETWNYALMDPDNRHAIDYAHIEESLKTKITRIAFTFRRSYPELFLQGDYIPCSVQKERSENIISFMRKKEKSYALIASGRFLEGLNTWSETHIVLPKEFELCTLTDIFTKKKHTPTKKEGKLILYISDLFQEHPFALLTNENIV